MKRTTKQVIADQQALNRKIWAKENGRLHHLDANKLIAEFMGMQHTDIGWYDNEETLQLQNNTFDELQFHKSWDWLMPVVEKIDEASDENILFKVEHNRAFIEDIENYHIFIDVIASSRLEATYQAVVQFIKDRG